MFYYYTCAQATNNERRAIHKYLMFHETHNIYDRSEGGTQKSIRIGGSYVKHVDLVHRCTTSATLEILNTLPLHKRFMRWQFEHILYSSKRIRLEKWKPFRCHVDWIWFSFSKSLFLISILIHEFSMEGPETYFQGTEGSPRGRLPSEL